LEKWLVGFLWLNGGCDNYCLLDLDLFDDRLLGLDVFDDRYVGIDWQILLAGRSEVELLDGRLDLEVLDARCNL
jgi:hypothetical protein